MALLAAYSFDESGTTVVDYSGNGRDWTLNNNAARTVTGHTNGGITKTGALMPVVASPSFVGTGAWTMMFWRLGLGDTVWWCRLYNTAADTGSGILLLGGTLRIRIRKTGNTEATTTPPADGLWHHYAATYDGTVGRLYVDGTLVATTATAAAPTAAVDRIDILEHTLANTFTDDLRFYDSALDQATIAALMNTPVAAAPALSGSVTLLSTAGLTVTGSRESQGAANLTAGATFAAAGIRSAPGTLPLATAAALGVTGVPSRQGSAALRATAVLRLSSSRNIDLTAVLAPQPAPAVTLGDRRWTATLEAQ